jgi:hypothetical protein
MKFLYDICNFDITPRTPVMYFLPKIHKPDNPGRPIISACGCPTELISSFLDRVMASLVKDLPSYIKDTKHALQILQNIHFHSTHKLIFTTDVKSLYTVIPHHDGLRAIKFFLDKRPNKEPIGWVGAKPQQFFLWWWALPTDKWCSHGNQNGTQLC